MIEKLSHDADTTSQVRDLTDKVNELVEEANVMRRTLDEVLKCFGGMRGRVPKDTGPIGAGAQRLK